jgi:hypothetical protein
MNRSIHSRIGYLDVFKHALGNACHGQRFYPGRTPVRESFQQVLSSLQSGIKESNSLIGKGLKIPDYFKHPVRVNFRPAKNARQNLTPSKPNPPLQKTEDPVVPYSNKSDARHFQTAGETDTEKPEIILKASQDASLRQKIDRAVGEAARKYGLPPNLIRGVIQAESSFRSQVVSAAGAQGLMQLMPATAKEMGVDDPFDIQQNIDGGSKYLKKMLKLFDGDIRKALAAYNAGPGTVQRYKGNVPYSETRNYIKRVLRYSGLPA